MVTEFPNAKWNEDTIFKPLEYEENEAVSLFDIWAIVSFVFR